MNGSAAATVLTPLELCAGERSPAQVRSLSLAETRAHHPLETRPILVIESDAASAMTLAEQLARDGYQVELAKTEEHARLRARWRAPRLIVLGELESPSRSMGLLEEIRQVIHEGAPWAPEVPVIVIGANMSELDLLRAFEAGADDFLARPARYLELRARIRAVLHRVESSGASTRQIEIDALTIDMSGHVVRMNGLSVRLRRLEFELLVHLASDPERVFTKQELLRAVWGYQSSGSTRTVDSHASRLRRKLEKHGGRWVINEWGVGYRLH